MFLRKNRYGIDLAGGRSPRKYEVSACATAGNNGSSMRTLVFGLLALSMPAFQSRSSNRSPRTSAAPRPYVASSNRIAKSRLPGGSQRWIDRRMSFTSLHGKVRGGVRTGYIVDTLDRRHP